jgi:hypothetical protein
MSRKSGNRFSDKDMRKSKKIDRIPIQPNRDGLAVEQPALRIPHKYSARSPGRGIAYATRLHDLYSRKQTNRRSERREVHMRKRVIVGLADGLVDVWRRLQLPFTRALTVETSFVKAAIASKPGQNRPRNGQRHVKSSRYRVGNARQEPNL